MIDLTEPLRAILVDFGQDALINSGPETLRLMLHPVAADDLSGGMIDHSGPAAIAVKADVEKLGVSLADFVTVDGAAYIVLAMNHDGLGGMIMRLGAKP